jgi:oligopeptide/dipeptide ABC transporter ATP-binding protein
MNNDIESVVFRVDNVVKEFGRSGGPLRFRHNNRMRALDDVTLELRRGEALGLVGESGSGKTTLGRILVGSEQPTQGNVSFEGRPTSSLRGRELKRFRRQVQMMFQNPFAALNPRRTVRDVLSAGFAAGGIAGEAQRMDAMGDLLKRVGLNESMLDRYPHAFSGGQRQRIVLARALTTNPSVLIADEPVSALDVSIQAQVLNLLMSLKRDLNLTILMITHDLRIANFFCDRIAVLYRGRLVELGSRAAIMDDSRHPYTRMLLSAAPSGNPDALVDRSWVRGDVGTAAPSTQSCVFSQRCWLREQLGNPERCVRERPQPRNVDGRHSTACHYAEEVPTAVRERPESRASARVHQ